MDDNPRATSIQRTGVYPRAVGRQRTDVNPRAVTRQRMDDSLRATSTQRMIVQPKAVDIQRTDVISRVIAKQRTDNNPRVVSARQKDVNPMVLATQRMDDNPRAASIQQMIVYPRAVSRQQTNVNPRVIARQQMDDSPKAASAQRTSVYPRAVDIQRTNVIPRVVTKQRTDNNPRAISVRRTDVNPMVLAIQRTDENPRPRSAHSQRKNPIEGKGYVKNQSAAEVFTIFGGPHEVGRSRHARNRYGHEARRPLQALVHKTDVRSIMGITWESEDIVFTKTDAKCVHYPHIDALFITVRIANSIVHRILVDNDNATNNVFWDAYRKNGLTQADLGPTTSPLYGFTKDHVIPGGTIKLAVTLEEHPQVSIAVTKFLAINCPSAFNEVIRRPLLRVLKAVTLIRCLTIKFPTATEIKQVQGK